MAALMTDDKCKKLIGEKIGEGGSRCVYAVKDDPTKVIKEVKQLPYFANVRELFIWNGVKDTPLAEVFGKCCAISKSGCYLVMERLDNITDADAADTPDVPEWVRDVWRNNFGRNVEGDIKLRDYGNVALDLPAERVARAWQLAARRKRDKT